MPEFVEQKHRRHGVEPRDGDVHIVDRATRWVAAKNDSRNRITQSGGEPVREAPHSVAVFPNVIERSPRGNTGGIRSCHIERSASESLLRSAVDARDDIPPAGHRDGADTDRSPDFVGRNGHCRQTGSIEVERDVAPRRDGIRMNRNALVEREGNNLIDGLNRADFVTHPQRRDQGDIVVEFCA